MGRPQNIPPLQESNSPGNIGLYSARLESRDNPQHGYHLRRRYAVPQQHMTSGAVGSRLTA